VWASGDAVGIAQGLKDHKISILDNCLPGDPGWDPTGGCTLKAKEGDVSFVEFGALLVSPLTQPPFQHLIVEFADEPAQYVLAGPKEWHPVVNREKASRDSSTAIGSASRNSRRHCSRSGLTRQRRPGQILFGVGGSRRNMNSRPNCELFFESWTHSVERYRISRGELTGLNREP
jgi:hypothetical protein